MAFFGAHGKQIEGPEWLKTFKPSYFLGGPVFGRRFTARSQSSHFIEAEIVALLHEHKLFARDDLMRIMAWKIGMINHPHSEKAQQIIYHNNWDTNLIDRYRRDFSPSITFLANMMPEILQKSEKHPQAIFDLHRQLKSFGPVYMLTILFFVTCGLQPIYDKFAHIAAQAIRQELHPGSYVEYRAVQSWEDYEQYKQLLASVALDCGLQAERMLVTRSLDRALWVYGHLFNYPGRASPQLAGC